MQYYSYPDNVKEYKVALLIKDSYFHHTRIQQVYIGKIQGNVIAIDLPYPNNKQTITPAREYLNKLADHIIKLGITHIYCTDALYFKALTGLQKTEPYIGYVVPCKLTKLQHIHVILGINYGQLHYNPNLYAKLDLSLQTLNNHINGTYKPLGIDNIKAEYPSTHQVADILQRIKSYPMLTCDIETTGLKLGSKLYTIAFGFDEKSGCAFKVENLRQLKHFFESYQGTLIFHNATFDIKQIIYNCFMTDENDIVGMLHGLHTMYRKVHDTKIIAYLATNNTVKNELGLKDLSHEYVGNYAIDVKDVTKHDIKDVLKYNLIDTCATWYVFNKYYSKMLQDNQQNIYQTLMLPSLKTITQMEMTGLPIDMKKVEEAENKLQEIQTIADNKIQQICIGLGITQKLKQQKLEKINAKLKVKQHTLDHLKDFKVNPNSDQQLQTILYDYLGLPVLDLTDSKQPAVASATLEKLIHHTQDEVVKNLLKALIEYTGVNKIITAFIPAFKQAKPRKTGYYLHGNLNLGGTLSGRLSSSEPNLQQIPSNSEYSKPIKQCFISTKQWLFVGADFSSLEDRINALLTKDNNKMKVYTDGYDGHMLRAISYFGLPVDINDVNAVNQAMNQYKKERQDSKPITFALTYGGTYKTLMDNCGFTEQQAKQIEANYHELYKQSDEWVKQKLKLCEQQGYIDVAFGLRIRTPILANTVLNTSKTSHIAQAEARSVGNAISGQSYGLLTNRALNAVMEQVWQSEYKYDILPACTIHDAIYFIIKNDIAVVKYINDLLIKEMQWQELQEIQHDKVHLEAELDIYYPNWANPITLANNITEEQIIETIENSNI